MKDIFSQCQVCGKDILTSPFHNETICNDCEIWAYQQMQTKEKEPIKSGRAKHFLWNELQDVADRKFYLEAAKNVIFNEIIYLEQIIDNYSSLIKQRS